MTGRGARASKLVLAMSFALAGAAGCVSPDTFVRNDGGPGAGGAVGAGGGPGAGGGTGTGGTTGAGGLTGAGGRTATGGRTGSAGSSGTGGTVIGPTANLMDDFETGNVADRWITDPASGLNGGSSACGSWGVAADGTTQVFQERTNCTSNPSWAAGGNRNWTDMKVEAKVKFVSATGTSTRITLAVRFVDDRNQYFLEYTNDGRIKIRYNIGGSSTDVMSSTGRVAVPNGTWNTVGLSVSGPASASTVSAFLNGVMVATGTASGLAAGGIGLGVQSGLASFDDVVVTPP